MNSSDDVRILSTGFDRYSDVVDINGESSLGLSVSSSGEWLRRLRINRPVYISRYEAAMRYAREGRDLPLHMQWRLMV